MLHPATPWALLGALAGLGALALRFYQRQNAGGRLGGAISGPKMAWLFFTVYLWFFVCPLVALDSGVRPGVRGVLGAFAASMWVRGVVELALLYVLRAWRPPYGVAHDLLCLALLGGGLALVPGALPDGGAPGDAWSAALLGLVVLSLCVETAYASLFFQAVAGHTVGQDGVWFANGEEARFHRINTLTLWLNVPQYAVLAGLLLAAPALVRS